jgi:hypothetical protein
MQEFRQINVTSKMSPVKVVNLNNVYSSQFLSVTRTTNDLRLMSNMAYTRFEPTKFLICKPRMYVGVEVYLHSLLTSALDEGKWLNNLPGKLPTMPTEYETG